MVTIHNCLQQRLIINLPRGKNLDIFAGGMAVVSEMELNSPHLQALIARGDVVVRSGIGGDKTHPVVKDEAPPPPVAGMDSKVQSEPVKQAKIPPEAGMEAKANPKQTGKGESTATPKKAPNPKTPMKECAGKK